MQPIRPTHRLRPPWRQRRPSSGGGPSCQLLVARHGAIVTSARPKGNGATPKTSLGYGAMRRQSRRSTIGQVTRSRRRTTMTTKHLLSLALVAAAALGILTAGSAAIAGPPNKSGGGSAPVELTLLNSDDDLSGVPAVARFVGDVAELSGGKLRIEVRPQGDHQSGFEGRVVRDVTAGKFQFAWVGTRVWDVLGVNTFRALHAPMLVDSYALESAVLRSDLP